jgi:hypothetical protein
MTNKSAPKKSGLIGKIMAAFPQKITRDQARDTGLAFVLIALLIAYWGDRPQAILAGIVLLILSMVWPKIYRPLAILWLGLSHLLGTVTSKIILTTLYVCLVIPVGLFRRMLGKDALQLKKWKKDQASVFQVRDHRILKEDLEQPY